MAKKDFGLLLGYTGRTPQHLHDHRTDGERNPANLPMVERLVTLLVWFKADYGYLPDLDNGRREPMEMPEVFNDQYFPLIDGPATSTEVIRRSKHLGRSGGLFQWNATVNASRDGDWRKVNITVFCDTRDDAIEAACKSVAAMGFISCSVDHIVRIGA